MLSCRRLLLSMQAMADVLDKFSAADADGMVRWVSCMGHAWICQWTSTQAMADALDKFSAADADGMMRLAPKQSGHAGQHQCLARTVSDKHMHVRLLSYRALRPAHAVQVPMVRPGDASMASPFTGRTGDIRPCADIIRQGRTTLVTTLQMFKILGLLCLSTAYSLSVQYLQVRLGWSLWPR